MRVFRYIVVYMLIIQFTLPLFLQLNPIYDYRMNYDLVKDNTENIDFILDKISRQIKASEGDYVIILGDSVGFSGPGPSTQSIGYFLEKQAQEESALAAKVYNLSMPAMQTGDIYTMLLKLDEKGIATDKLIFNVIYAGFVARNPDPPPVFWLKEELKRLDKEAYDHIYPALSANGYKEEKGILAAIKRILWDKIALLKYKDVLKLNTFSYLPFINEEAETLGDFRPWYEKEGLAEMLQEPEYLNSFLDTPFDMSKNNPQIFFLEKILEHQKGKDTLVYIGGTNTELMPEQVNAPGYKDNLAQIDNYFMEREVTYINFQNKIDNQYFTDHVHLTGEGYQKMVQIIYAKINEGD